MEGIWNDARYAVRTLVANPAYAVVAVLTLGLSVGVTTAMFSAVDSVLLRPLPYDAADSIVVLREVDPRNGAQRRGISAANARDVATLSRALSHVSIANAYGFTLLEDGRASSVRGYKVSDGFFTATGGDAALGRTFLAEEFVEGRERVILLSHGSWLSRFSGDSSVVGQDVILDGAAHRVVGVLEADFKYPAPGEIFAPRPPLPWDAEARGAAQMHGVARFSSGAGMGEAQAELDRIAGELAAIHPELDAGMGFRITRLEDHLFGAVRSPLLLLMGAVGLVLLIAVANIAGLQLARGVGRSRELALRAALGAGRARILRLTVLESVVLGLTGAGLGVGLAFLGLDFVRWLVPNDVPRIDELGIDARVLGFSFVTSMIAALLSAAVPSLMAMKTDVHGTLQRASPRSAGGREAGSFRDRLIVMEIALALVLMIGAGLLVQSYDRLLDNDLGFEPENRLAVQTFAYDENDEPDLAFVRLASEAIAGLPGIESVGVTTAIPLADNESVWRMAGDRPVRVEGATSPDDAANARLIAITSEYPRAIGLDLEVGRTFDERDGPTSVPVAMVNEAFARRHFPTRGGPVGRRIAVGAESGEWREIVGVLGDVRPEGFASAPVPEIYVPFHQAPTTGGVTFVIRTTTDPAAHANAVRDAVWEVDPDQAIWASRPVPDLLSDWSRQRRFNTVLLSLFAGLALTLSGIGVYGLMASSVRQRTNELGIRRALGGHARDVVRMVLRHALLLAMTGVGLGLVGSLAMSYLLRGMLFGIGPFDLATFGTVAAFVIFVALASAAIPARRATEVDPMVALRRE